MSLFQLCFQSNVVQGALFELRYFLCRLQSGSFLEFWSGMTRAGGATDICAAQAAAASGNFFFSCFSVVVRGYKRQEHPDGAV